MNKPTQVKTAVRFVSIAALVTVLSLISSQIWGGKPEEPVEIEDIKIEEGMTIREFGDVNALPNPVLKEIFGLTSPSDLGKKLDEYGTPEHISATTTKKVALASEHASKNWVKISAKFALWLVFLSAVFVFLRNRSLSHARRKWLYLTGVIVFGVIMGSDPSPMGTVKDAIHLYGSTGAIFPPRMIALVIFLALVFFANKFICAWGCQVGTLQDLVFRINRTDKHKAIIGRQIKLPFVLTNAVRFTFLAAFTLVVLLWGADIIEPIDPFKVYKPAHLGIVGGLFIGVLLLASLFVYRPWCHLFCPFGLVGWLVEKTSLVKISVDYDTCIACEKCAKACPSSVMGAILKRNKTTIPDCFACYTCREVCPTGSISFSTRRRTEPPTDRFTRRGDGANAA